jgi:hypothetical protein
MDPPSPPPGMFADTADAASSPARHAIKLWNTASCMAGSNCTPPTCPATHRTLPAIPCSASNFTQTRSPISGRSTNSILQPRGERSKIRTRKLRPPLRRIPASAVEMARSDDLATRGEGSERPLTTGPGGIRSNSVARRPAGTANGPSRLGTSQWVRTPGAMLRDMLLERGYSLVRNGPFARDPNSFGAAAGPIIFRYLWRPNVRD